jgi:hypothetical protein
LRADVASFVRIAYDARSKIVHGGALALKDLKAIDRSQVSASEFAELVRDVARACIRTAVERIAARQPFPPDWDDLLFPEPT